MRCPPRARPSAPPARRRPMAEEEAAPEILKSQQDRGLEANRRRQQDERGGQVCALLHRPTRGVGHVASDRDVEADGSDREQEGQRPPCERVLAEPAWSEMVRDHPEHDQVAEDEKSFRDEGRDVVAASGQAIARPDGRHYPCSLGDTSERLPRLGAGSSTERTGPGSRTAFLSAFSSSSFLPSRASSDRCSIVQSRSSRLRLTGETTSMIAWLMVGLTPSSAVSKSSVSRSPALRPVNFSSMSSPGRRPRDRIRAWARLAMLIGVPMSSM